MSDPGQPHPRARRLRLYLFVGLGLILVWQAGTRGLAAYFARSDPELALIFNPAEPTALLRLAQRKLASGGADEAPDTPSLARGPDGEVERLEGWAEIALRALAERSGLEGGRPVVVKPLDVKGRAEVRALAVAALRSDPLNARALRLLGLMAEADGDMKKAEAFMRAAAGVISETGAVLWMLNHSAAAKDYPQVLYYADALLRKRPQAIEAVAPVLARLAESPDPAAAAALEAALKRPPPWRRAFFATLPRAMTDARTPLKLLLSLKETSAPPTLEELNPYLRFLIARKFYEIAYYAWLQFLPASELASLGLMTNGDFSQPPSGMPFDWDITQTSGVNIELVERSESPGNRALYVELGPARVDFAVTQVLMLPPGTYRFEGKFKGEIFGRRGLRWRVRCLPARAVVGEGPMFTGMATRWEVVGFDIAVPEKECRAQELRLALDARSASEQLASGFVWYDELKMSRTTAPPPPPAEPSVPTPPSASSSEQTPTVPTQPPATLPSPPTRQPQALRGSPDSPAVTTPAAPIKLTPEPATPPQIPTAQPQMRPAPEHTPTAPLSTQAPATPSPPPMPLRKTPMPTPATPKSPAAPAQAPTSMP